MPAQCTGSFPKAFECIALWTFVVIFLFTAETVFKLSRPATQQIVLDCVYGVETVKQDHLELHHTAFGEQVSNGDMLGGRWTALLFFVNGAIALTSFVVGFLLLVFLMPGSYRAIVWSFSKEMSASRDRGLPIPVLLMLIPTIVLMMAFTRQPIACALTALSAVASAWVITGLRWLCHRTFHHEQDLIASSEVYDRLDHHGS